MHTSPRLRSLVEATAFSTVRWLLVPLPLPLVSVLGEGLGWFLFAVLRLRRRQTESNLEIAFGDLYSPAERRRLARECFRQMGALFTEFLCHSRIAKKVGQVLPLENPELLDEGLGQGRGVLLVVSHLGNWELLGPAIAARGIPVDAYVGQQHNLIADGFVNDLRRSGGMGTIPKRGGMRGMFRCLRMNRVMAVLSDQHFSRGRHYVRFFGQLVSVAPGMGALALRQRPFVVVSESYKVGRLRYRGRLIPLPIPPSSGNEEYDLLEITQRYMHILEDAIRRHPEQYFWMHRRFRPPPADADLSQTNRAFLAGEPPPAGKSPARSGAASGGR